jgi:hypothetical protein
VIVCVTVTSGFADAEFELTPGVPDSEVLPSEGVFSEAVGAPPDSVPVTDGVKLTEGVVGDEDEVHAETATGTRRARAPQQRAVSLTLNCVPRTFMNPSSCAGQMTIVFPFPAAETGIPERKTRH